ARPHGVLRLRDRRDDQGGAASDRDDHLEQREGAARRVPAPLLLPLHQVPRARDDAEDRRRALSAHQAEAGQRGAERLLPDPRSARPQEEAVDQRIARLAEAALERGRVARGAAREGPDQADPAAARRAAQERTGRASVRAAGVFGTAGEPELMRATAALAAVTICGPFVAMSAQSGENLCDHLRAFERAPMETAENGKPGRRWVELHWIGGWTDFTTGWHMECRDSGAMASKALCAWLSNNTTFEFSNGVPMTFLEC